jgi:hypothetical protein
MVDGGRAEDVPHQQDDEDALAAPAEVLSG